MSDEGDAAPDEGPLAHPGSTFEAEPEEEAGAEGSEDEEEGSEDAEEEEAEEKGPSTPLASGARPAPKPSTPEEKRKAIVRFVLFFLGFLGLFMLIDPSCWSNPPAATCSRIEIANAIGLLLAPVLGFSGQHLLATMFLAAALEMGMSAVAYHVTTDWIETARVAKHGQAIRPLWMKAQRSQKKDRIAALKPHMDSLNVRQSRVTINQFKGMVITWVLLIAIYTWVGLFITAQCPTAAVAPLTTSFVGAPVEINATAGSGHGPYLYTWWAQLSGTTVVGPYNTPGPTWTFTPTQPGTYDITLQVTDQRGNIAVATNTLSVAGSSVSAPPSRAPADSPVPAEVITTPPSVPTSKGCAGSSVNYFGITTNLLTGVGPFPLWFLAFSLYTFPLNLIFRRYLKHSALAQELKRLGPMPSAETTPTPPATGVA